MLKPEVGQSYVTNSNTIIKIIKENKGLGYPFVADDGKHYDDKGRAYHGAHFDIKRSVNS
jgi:hypothetical protein